MIYQIQTFDLAEKKIYVSTERPDLKVVKGEHGAGDYFVNEAGEREDPPRGDYKFECSLAMYKKAIMGFDDIVHAKDHPVYLPYFADVTEDLPTSARKLKIEPQTYKNAQLLVQKHGGYLEFFHHETGKTLRIALNSNTYTPVEPDLSEFE